MVKIRLRRMGAKKAPYYRIIVADSRSPRDGRFIEELGIYDPMADGEKIKVDMERAKYWISNGAQPTDTVRGLLKKIEAWQGYFAYSRSRRRCSRASMRSSRSIMMVPPTSGNSKSQQMRSNFRTR